MKLFRQLSLMAIACFSIFASQAHQFEKEGIYYNILDRTNKTVEVTYRGDDYGRYPYRYSGHVTIPATISYDGTPYTVAKIAMSAFQECTELTGITIPSTVEVIDNCAFWRCPKLTSVELPSGVTTIGEGAFGYNDGITKITVNSDNKTFDSRNNCNAIIETATNTLVAGCKNTVIPSSVVKIGSSAFVGNQAITSMEIPNGVTEIGDAAFQNCEKLTSIVLPNSVTKIGSYAFYYCSEVTSISIPNAVTTIGDYAFQYCSKTENVYSYAVVPPVCGSYAFDYVFQTCKNLYVPKGSKTAYSETMPWRFFNNIIDNLSGIDDVTVDTNNAPIEYFDLNGIRVNNPENGIFIKRQGKNAEKVIIK